MIEYPDGTVARRGDRIEVDGYNAVVEDIVDSDAKRGEWGIEERGLMIRCAEIGLVFAPISQADWASTRYLWRGIPE